MKKSIVFVCFLFLFKELFAQSSGDVASFSKVSDDSSFLGMPRSEILQHFPSATVTRDLHEGEV